MSSHVIGTIEKKTAGYFKKNINKMKQNTQTQREINDG